MRIEVTDKKLIIHLEGRIDSNNVADVEKEVLDSIVANKGLDLIMDADILEYISSAGLRMLMKVRKNRKRPYPIINVSRDVYEIFDMTGFTQLLDVNKKIREISVEGCEIVGKGGNGTVYRLDEDKIVKLYHGQSMDLVQREQEFSRIAFINGIPSVIPYDVVKCGDDYGVVFEMVHSDTLGHAIAAHPEKMMEYVDQWVQLARILHSTHIEPGNMPNVKDHMRRNAKNLGRWCSDEEIKALLDIIDSIPDCDTVLHNDLHPGNVMIQGDELVLIDLAEMSTGPKVFDLASIFRDMISGARTNPELSEMTVGMPVDMIEQVGSVFFSKYTGITDPAALKEYFDRLGLIYGLNVVLLCGAGIGETEKYAAGIMDRLLRPVVLPNAAAIPQLIAALSQ